MPICRARISTTFWLSSFRGLFTDGLRVLLIGQDRIHCIAEERLRG
jgi:hypothetical protein